MKSHTFTMSCPLRDCDEGILTVEISGCYRSARGFDPPEWPELEILAATCGHLDAAYNHRDFETWAMDAAEESVAR